MVVRGLTGGSPRITTRPGLVDDLEQAFSKLARTLASAGRAVIRLGDPDAMGKLSVTSHGFRLRPVANIEAALVRAGLTLSEHIEVGEGRIPAHLLVSTLESGHQAPVAADRPAAPDG